ncbi:hypothetical protein JCM11641_006982 [Rhodosporidiobolus odoratus]
MIAAHVHNLSPTVSFPNSISPAHANHSSIPDLSHLQARGCIAHIYVDGPRRGAKVQRRSVRRRFIGYVYGIKGWNFWVPEWKKTVMAWSVRWFEKEYGKVTAELEDRECEAWLEDMLEKADEVDEGPRMPEQGGVKVKAPSQVEDDLIIPPSVPPSYSPTPEPTPPAQDPIPTPTPSPTTSPALSLTSAPSPPSTSKPTPSTTIR